MIKKKLRGDKRGWGTEGVKRGGGGERMWERERKNVGEGGERVITWDNMWRETLVDCREFSSRGENT